MEPSDMVMPPPPPRDLRAIPGVHTSKSIQMAITERDSQFIHGHLEGFEQAHILAMRVNEADGINEAMLEGTTMLMRKLITANMNSGWDSRSTIAYLVDAIRMAESMITTGFKSVNRIERHLYAAKLTAMARIARDSNENMATAKLQDTIVTSYSGNLITVPKIMLEAVDTFLRTEGIYEA